MDDALIHILYKRATLYSFLRSCHQGDRPMSLARIALIIIFAPIRTSALVVCIQRLSMLMKFIAAILSKTNSLPVVSESRGAEKAAAPLPSRGQTVFCFFDAENPTLLLYPLESADKH